jgi:hypothetical protein
MENNQNSMTALVSAFGRAYHNEANYFAGRNDYLHAFEHINYVLAVTGKE